MHAGQFAVVRLCDVDVQGLALVDVGTAIGGHLEYCLLGDFPHRFIQLLQIIWNSFNVLLKQTKQLEMSQCYKTGNLEDHLPEKLEYRKTNLSILLLVIQVI